MTERLSLTELQLLIRDSIYLSLPDTYWVIAEISELKENYAGHCYLELIEKQSDEKNVKARIKAIIWNKRYGFLKSYFENITGESIREGIKILVKVKIEYHELYGLSLVITGMDPSFTIGEMALKRQQVIKRLEQEGVFTMNKDIEFPDVPQRIAIISSKSAAGFSDFIQHLTENKYGYIFYTALIETVMQGKETEQSVINALDRIALNQHLFDLVVIIRGGGSQTDLSWFDSYNIAYHVTQFPLPVITGIGHDKDLSVTDMVASKALKTPTAVADFIIESVAEAERKLIVMGSEIQDLARLIIENNRNLVENLRINLIPAARIYHSNVKSKLANQIIAAVNVVKGYINRAGLINERQSSLLFTAVRSISLLKEIQLDRIRLNMVSLTQNCLILNSKRLDGLENTLFILDPENVLKRGYTITSLNGRILKKMDRLEADDLIDTRFSDGSVRSKVVEMDRG